MHGLSAVHDAYRNKMLTRAVYSLYHETGMNCLTTSNQLKYLISEQTGSFPKDACINSD